MTFCRSRRRRRSISPSHQVRVRHHFQGDRIDRTGATRAGASFGRCTSNHASCRLDGAQTSSSYDGQPGLFSPSVRAERKFLNRIKLMLPVQSCLKKYFCFRTPQITSRTFRIPSHTEGRFAIVTDVGHGMRWTRQRFACHGIAGRVL